MNRLKLTIAFFISITSTFTGIAQTSVVLADGKSVQELVPGVDSFEFQFAMTEEAAKGGYGFKGPMKTMLKARGGTDFSYGVVFDVKDGNGCGDKHNPMYNERGKVKAMGWIDMVKAGETVNAVIAGEDIYDGLNNFLRKCGSTPSNMSLEIRLLTLAQSKMGKNESGDIDHELSKITIPISNSAVGSMMSAADEKVYEEFRTGNKAHRVKDEVLLQSIEEELDRLKKGKAEIMTIHVQDISYQNAQNTVLKWYAHNIYKNTDGQCKYGYIYGEASKYSGGYSFNYFNGEREEFIGCEYAEKLRNR